MPERIAAPSWSSTAVLPPVGYDGLATRANRGVDSEQEVLAPGTNPATLLFDWRGESPTDSFGMGAGSAGDVDADGHDDLIVGAPNADPAGIENAGSAFVYSGTNGQLLLQFDGAAVETGLGYSVTGGADFDGDDHRDVLIGAVGIDTVFAYSGANGSELYHVSASPGFFGSCCLFR